AGHGRRRAAVARPAGRRPPAVSRARDRADLAPASPVDRHAADWHAVKDRLPSTLAHDDFNQRNVGFRSQATTRDIVVLDWELVECNTAQRDLVEMLTFALLPIADRPRVDRHVEAHRLALVAAGASTDVDRDSWIEGFRCELKIEAINRIALQLLFAAQFPVAYVARINATIERLLDLYE